MTAKARLNAVAITAVLATLAVGAAGAHAAFPGKPGAILYESEGVGGESDIFALAPGGAVANLTNSDGVEESYPGSSADGRTIVYQRDANVWVMNADGSGQHQAFAGEGGYPTFASDGRIAFGRDNEIWIGRDGGAPQQLTSFGFDSTYDPAFSPDGRLLAFSGSDSPSPPRIHILNSTTGALQTTLNSGHPESDYYSNFSPDGTRILFSSDDTIYEYTLASGVFRTVAGDPVAQPYNPVYAPDNSRLLAGDSTSTLLSYSPSGAFLGPIGSGENPEWAPIPVNCGGKRATLVGTGAADRLTGTARADVIAGLGGKDRISGLAGNDVLCGGAGKDRLAGGKGKDKLLGGKANDRCAGGGGKDRGKGCEKEKSV
jgi:Ca2+-binding RTX toxin-like protein